MADNNVTSSSQQTQNPTGKPLLKKVKRPVKKLIKRPLSPATPHLGQDIRRPQNPLSMPNENISSRSQNMYGGTDEMRNKDHSISEFSNDINFNDMSDIKSIVADMKSSQSKDTHSDTSSSNVILSNQNLNAEPPQFVSDSDLISSKTDKSFVNSLYANKFVQISVLIAFIIGFILAKLFFTENKIVTEGLQGVVANPEVPRGRARCGIAERTQGCVLYIMNPQRQDLNARDFYDLAAQLTGRQRFVIETGNMRYSNVKISPGEIAQFNIPPLQ